MQQTILIAHNDHQLVDALATQLVLDDHDVHIATDATGAIAKLVAHATDVLILGELDTPAAATRLLRDLRAGQLHRRVHPGQPVITLGASDTVTALRAYEAGSDHHTHVEVDVLELRAIVAAVTRRASGEQQTPREIRVGEITIDTAARTVHVGDQAVHLTRIEFDLLATLADDPHRVMTKDQLMRAVWGTGDTGRTRTLDSHATRLRRQLADAGAPDVVLNRWGVGYHLLPEDRAR